MNFKWYSLWFIPILMTGCSDKNLEAGEPIDYKDELRNSYGSLIKDKDSVLRTYFSKSSDKGKAGLIQRASGSTSKDKMWNAVFDALSEFPIEFMDKKSGKIETEKVKIQDFDNTGSCMYKISVTIHNEKDIDVVVTSPEDSDVRLKKHAETIKSKILETYKK